jgi:phosphoribosylanthranilate isomerase
MCSLRQGNLFWQGKDQMVKVKICGITNPEDATLAVALGVDALGFIFAPSPRQVSPENAQRIIDSLPPFVQKVGVFVDGDLRSIQDIKDFCGLDVIQLHGDESPDFCQEFMPETIKAFRLKNDSSLQPIRRYQGKVSALLLDTYQEGLKGGTGKPFEWGLAVKARGFGIPVILSGGLGPSNIARAVLTVRPYAIDVNSSIERRPGIKDPVLMKQLMEKVKNMNSRRLLDE